MSMLWYKHTEAFPLNVTDQAKLSLPATQAFMKIFCAVDNAVVRDCQFLRDFF